MRFYQAAIADGNSDAFSGVGHLYRYGLGVQKDYFQALSWYEKASDNAYSDMDVGEMYEQGLGAAADPAMAQTWYAKAGPGAAHVVQGCG